MAAPGARRLSLSTQEQSTTVVPETAPAEKRRQQVSESWVRGPRSGSIIAKKDKKRNLSGKRREFLAIFYLPFYYILNEEMKISHKLSILQIH